jgi:curli biogenesis system outer membrane secretion channel CsgG
MTASRIRLRPALLACALVVAACATESHRTVPVPPVESAYRPYDGPKYEVAVGKFVNASPYMRGIFSDGADQLGGQAKTILSSHLAQSNRFTVVDRENMEEIARESEIRADTQALTGARLVLTGQVTEFGRKTTGDEQLFGILGRGKKQTAYSKVAINVVDVRTSQVVYSVQGAGEYELSEREVLGTGGTSGYDATLNGKVLDHSIRDAVEKLVLGLERGEWKPTGGGS